MRKRLAYLSASFRYIPKTFQIIFVKDCGAVLDFDPTKR